MPIAGSGTLLIPGSLPWELSAFRRRLSLRENSLSGVSSPGASSRGEGSTTVKKAIAGFNCGKRCKSHQQQACNPWREEKMDAGLQWHNARTVLVPVGRREEHARRRRGVSGGQRQDSMFDLRLQRYGGKERIVA